MGIPRYMNNAFAELKKAREHAEKAARRATDFCQNVPHSDVTAESREKAGSLCMKAEYAISHYRSAVMAINAASEYYDQHDFVLARRCANAATTAAKESQADDAAAIFSRSGSIPARSQLIWRYQDGMPSLYDF